MRTTIELPDELRARLLHIAATRGEKGFSGLVAEAVARYLEEIDSREERVEAALDALGSITPEQAAALEESVRRARGRWR